MKVTKSPLGGSDAVRNIYVCICVCAHAHRLSHETTKEFKLAREVMILLTLNLGNSNMGMKAKTE